MSLVGPIAIAVFAAVIIGLVARRLFLQRRRQRLLTTPLTEDERRLLEATVPQARRLPATLRTPLEGMVQIFLTEKRFEACGKLEEITDEMRVAIAGNACLLLCGNPQLHPYPLLRSVLVYPEAYTRPDEEFAAPHPDPGLGDLVASDEGPMLGESWDSGSVILSWKDVVSSFGRPADGFNLVIHEFAHQLDSLSGDANGAPPLPSRAAYGTWQEVFTAAYRHHARKVESGAPLLIDEYGASAPEEFFAVASETFFELPHELHDHYPDLYRELKRYYRLDPRKW